MQIRKKDGCCRSCKGQLEVVEADDISMTVSCLSCGDSYDMEIDAFGDGGLDYYLNFMTSRMKEEDSE